MEKCIMCKNEFSTSELYENGEICLWCLVIDNKGFHQSVYDYIHNNEFSVVEKYGSVEQFLRDVYDCAIA